MKNSISWLIRVAMVFLALAALQAAERYEFRGKVYLPDGRILIGGLVLLEGVASPFSASTQTGFDGGFKFKKLEPGMYRVLIVTAMGEMEQSIEVGPSSADKKRRIEATFKFEPQFHSEGRATVSVKQLAVPDAAKKEYGKAIKALNRRDSEGAIKHLQNAIELAPHYSMALNRLGTIFYISQDYARAEAYFRKALQHAPDSYSPVINLGAALLSLGKLEEALEFNRRAVQMRPQDPLAHSQLGQNYWALGEPDQAVRELKLAKELDPGHFSYPQLILAEIYQQLKDFRGVARELEEFLENHPDSPISEEIEESLGRLRSGQTP